MRLRSHRTPIVFSNLGHGLTHLLMLLYPTVVLSLDGAFGLTYGELLTLALPGTILYGAAALPAGWLGDRWSHEAMMIVFFLGSGVAAMATGLANGPLGLAAGLGLIGLFGAIYHPVGVAWLVRDAVNRGRLLGWNGIFGSLGVGAASLVAGALTAAAGWRAAFIVPGAVCFVVGLALVVATRGGPLPARAVVHAASAEPGRAEMRRAFLVLSVTMVGSGVVWQAMTVALPKLFADRAGGLIDGSVLGTGGLVSIVFTFSGLTQLLGGWAADRFPLKTVYLAAWALQVPVLFALVEMADVPLVTAATLVYCLMVIAGPVETTLLARYAPARWRATAFGAKFLLSLGVAAAGLPLVAILHDRTGGFAWMFVVLGVIAIIVAAAILFLPSASAQTTPAPVAAPAE